MTAQYHVLVYDEMMNDDVDWASVGLTPIEQEPTDPGQYAGAHWWLFEDAAASPDLGGKCVLIEFGVRTGDDGTRAPYIIDRIPWHDE
jgi:hypothetical protein